MGIVQKRVEEVVDRGPAATRADAKGGEFPVDIVGTVDVAGIAHILIIPRGAGQPEGVMPPDGILHDLDQRFVIDGEVFRMQPRHRVERPHQRPRRRRVDFPLKPAVQRAKREGLKIRTLPPLDVKDLDVLPRLHLIGDRLTRLDIGIQQGVGQRIGRDQHVLAVRQHGATDVKHDLGRRPLLLRFHRAACGTDDQQTIDRGGETGHVPGAGPALEHHGGIGAAEVEARFLKRAHHLAARGIGQKRGFQPLWVASSLRSDHRGIGPPVMGVEDQFHRLQALAVLDGDLIPLEDRHGAAAAPRHRMPFDARRKDRQSGNHDPGPFEGSFQNGLHVGPVLRF